MTTDVVLASLHHLLILMYAGVFIAEAFLLRPGLGGANLKLLARLDSMYGSIAGAVIVIGIARVYFGLKGWEYYIYYWVFWAKMSAFALMGLLSVVPTMRIIQWRKAAEADPAYVVPDQDVAAARTFVRAEAAAFALVPIFAAMMARGVAY